MAAPWGCRHPRHRLRTWITLPGGQGAKSSPPIHPALQKAGETFVQVKLSRKQPNATEA